MVAMNFPPEIEIVFHPKQKNQYFLTLPKLIVLKQQGQIFCIFQVNLYYSMQFGNINLKESMPLYQKLNGRSLAQQR